MCTVRRASPVVTYGRLLACFLAGVFGCAPTNRWVSEPIGAMQDPPTGGERGPEGGPLSGSIVGSTVTLPRTGWRCSGEARFRNGAVVLRAALRGRTSCTSSVFPVLPGRHMEGSGQLTLSSISASADSHLDDLIKIQIFFIDRNGNRIAARARRLITEVDASDLTAALKSVPASLLLSFKTGTNLTLLSGHYPTDAGWIPEESVGAQLVVQSRSADLNLDNLTFRYSRWNDPLSASISAENRSVPFAFEKRIKPPRLLVANSQGTARTQLARLPAALKELTTLGINGLCIEVRPDDTLNGRPSSALVRVAERLRLYQVEHPTFSFGFSYNPYWRDEWKPTPVALSRGAVRKAVNVLAPLMERGAEFTLLRADDLVPTAPGERFGYTLAEGDKRVFASLGEGHASFLNQVSETLLTRQKALKIYFVPPWYNSFFIKGAEGRAERYFADLAMHVQQPLRLIWTGPSVRSLVIDEISARNFARLAKSASLSLWDNTLYARRHKDFWLNRADRVSRTSLFEPYDVRLSSDYLSEDWGAAQLVFLNVNPTQLQAIQLATAAAFFNDPEGYRPVDALWSYMTTRFGRTAAEALVRFDASLNRWRAGALSNPAQCTSVAAYEALKAASLEIRATVGPTGPALVEELLSRSENEQRELCD